MIEVRINIFVHEHNNHNSQKGFFLNTKIKCFLTELKVVILAELYHFQQETKREQQLNENKQEKQITNNSLREFKLAQSVAV